LLLLLLCLSVSLYAVDTDSDGVSDEVELSMGTNPNNGQEYDGLVNESGQFSYAFNLYDDWSKYLIDSYQAEVYSEKAAGNATFWRPTVQGEEGYYVYQIPVNKPIASAKLKAQIYAWTQGATVNYDQNAYAYLDVSSDGETWHQVDSMSAGVMAQNDVIDISEYVNGASSVFIRSRLLGNTLWPTDGLIFAQSLRTSNSSSSFVLVINTIENSSTNSQDSDGDGLDDSVETNTGVYVSETDTGTDPNNADTDGDSLKDGLEVSNGSDALSAQSPNWDYEVSYQSPLVSENEQYVFSKNNIQARRESSRISYWCPIQTDSPATLTQKFVFDDNSESIFLNIDYLYIANFSSSSYGFGEIYASTNGEDWELILSGPRPSSIASGYFYNEYLPDNLLGSKELWIQTRLQASGWNIMAQFLRYSNDRVNNCFDLKVSYLSARTDPLTPVIDLETFYESNNGESITIDATPTDGYPTNYTYQWYFNNSPISPSFGGASSSLTLTGSSFDDGAWKVEVTNGTGTTSAEFEYRVFVDTDGDSLSDYREANLIGTDPNDNDSDDDSLLDGVETNTGIWLSTSDTGTDPLSDDTDDDGLLDGVETNTAEYVDASDKGTDPNNPDTDGDGLLDGAESNSGIFVDSSDTGTNPLEVDSDSDSIQDGYETATGVWESATDTGTDPTKGDSDGDSLSDGAETNSGTFVDLSNTGTDPNSTDSDGDGFTDNYEINTSYDPTNSTDTPDAVLIVKTAVELEFHGANGGTYRIEHSTDLGSWTTIEDNIQGESALVERLHSIDDYSRHFFRVVRTDQ